MAPPAISPTANWIGTLLFVLLALGAITLFATRARELIVLLVKARPENRTDHLGDRIGQFMSENPDADVLYWVGCMGSFDQRNKQVATAVDHRAGHNGYAASNAVAGVAVKHRTSVTACPHCFNTIKNEYPQLGGSYEVVHHTVFIDRLLAGRRSPSPPALTGVR